MAGFNYNAPATTLPKRFIEERFDGEYFKVVQEEDELERSSSQSGDILTEPPAFDARPVLGILGLAPIPAKPQPNTVP